MMHSQAHKVCGKIMATADAGKLKGIENQIYRPVLIASL